ncbi:hypothetical protein Pcinc_023881, partial [Petrolisthes cinctipes]
MWELTLGKTPELDYPGAGLPSLPPPPPCTDHVRCVGVVCLADPDLHLVSAGGHTSRLWDSVVVLFGLEASGGSFRA